MTGGSIHAFFWVVSSTQDRDDGGGDRITTLNTGWKQIRRPKPEKTSCKRKQTRRENAKDENATIRNTQQRQKKNTKRNGQDTSE